MTFSSFRFYAALSLHVLATALFCETGIPGPFAPQQMFTAVIIGFLLMATLCWEWKLFGEPRETPSFLLHVGFFFSISFLISRMYWQSPFFEGLLSWMARGVAAVTHSLLPIPEGIANILSSPTIILLFVSVSLALFMKPRWGIATLVFIGVVWISLYGLDAAVPGKIWFFLGCLCLGGALKLQYVPREDQVFWNRVLARMEGSPHIRGDLELKIRILKTLRLGKPFLTREECCGIVARHLDASPADPVVKAVLLRLIDQMVLSEFILELTYQGPNAVLRLNPALARTDDDIFCAISLVPKAVVMALLIGIWVVSPIDLVPDWLPGGVIDDSIVAIIGSHAVFGSLPNLLPGRPSGE